MIRRIWLITSGEPLPLDGDDKRLLRHGLLAQILLERGWDVTWWTSAFDHTTKRHREIPPGGVQHLSERYRIVLLKSRGYSRHVSLKRLLDHSDVAGEFARLAPTQTRPDVILASFPTIHLAHVAVQFAHAHAVPVALDLRDLWPDIFLEAIPKWLSGIGRFALRKQFRSAGAALRGASALTGITDAFVHWGLNRADRSSNNLDVSFPLASHSQPPHLASEVTTTRLETVGVHSHHRVVCFFGAIGRQFDWPTVAGAAKLIARQDHRIRLVICGVGERFNYLSERTHTFGNVLMPGWIDREMIGDIMSVARGGLAPYTNELSFGMSIPNKVIEYLGGGLPVITSLLGETRNLLSEHALGYFYPYGDSVALANQIRAVCGDDSGSDGNRVRAKGVFDLRFEASHVYGNMSDWLVEVSARK